MFVKNLVLALYCFAVGVATNDLRKEGKGIAGGVFLMVITLLALIS